MILSNCVDLLGRPPRHHGPPARPPVALAAPSLLVISLSHSSMACDSPGLVGTTARSIRFNQSVRLPLSDAKSPLQRVLVPASPPPCRLDDRGGLCYRSCPILPDMPPPPAGGAPLHGERLLWPPFVLKLYLQLPLQPALFRLLVTSRFAGAFHPN